MAELHAALSERVAAWRDTGYRHDDFPAIAEIPHYATDDDATGHLRYLRAAQFRALETYWYLRLVERTPRIPRLYERLFERTSDRLEALGLTAQELRDLALDLGYDGLIERIRTDDALARRHRLDALRETFALAYPSWILALAMGAGKTILVGAIIATEFAMAIEYPDAGDGSTPFIENALVFAPGTTIIEALRELATIPFDRIVPPRLHDQFAASLKITFTRDGERDIPVIRGSRFNLVVTNTEKIRIQAQPRRRRNGAAAIALWDHGDEEAREVANLRLQSIASLPHLGVFSDEAHHTYGNALSTDLKRVRQTVNYLAQATNVIAVVNTTGTPYFQRQPLRDVVVWYGLRQGIEHGILKEVAGNIQAFDFRPDQADAFVSHVVADFFETYRDHRLPDGSPARLAIYFPQNDDLDELEPAVALAVARAGLSPATLLRNTSRSTTAEVDAFNRLNEPEAPHRVILLVNKGTEGWNCPSLFATALARRLRTSNNFVLQAASRCLRQVPGNTLGARIYLSEANRGALDQQLRETYGESLAELNQQRRESTITVIRLRKTDIPPMRLRQPRRSLRRADGPVEALTFERPDAAPYALTARMFDVGLSVASQRVLRQLGETLEIPVEADTIDLRSAAAQLAANYRTDPWRMLDALRPIYPDGVVPAAALEALGSQFEAQGGEYVEVIEDEEVDLALVKPEGWETAFVDGVPIHQAEIHYPTDRAHLVWPIDRTARENPAEYGYHYTPYTFDSGPEAAFYEQVLRELNLNPDDVQDVYFTGAITDPRRTDLTFAYAGRMDASIGTSRTS